MLKPSLLAKTIAWAYARYFGIVFFAITFLYALLDMVFSSQLPQATNLKVLYLFFGFIETASITLSFCIIFAFVLVLRKFILGSEFIALQSLGANKKQILLPLIGLIASITLGFVGLNVGELAHAGDQKKLLAKHNRLFAEQNNVFLKHNNAYVFFERLIPSTQSAQGIKIFEVSPTTLDLQVVHYAPSANFRENNWILKEAKTLHYNKNPFAKTANLADANLTTTTQTLEVLKDFNPDLISSIYENRTTFSILEALQIIRLFQVQNLSTNKARSTLYKNTVVPFFTIGLVVIIFYFAPLSARLGNLNIFSLISVSAGFGTFGIFKMLENLSYNASGLYTEAFLLLPMLVLGILSVYFYKRLN